jgi:hypothetical protein
MYLGALFSLLISILLTPRNSLALDTPWQVQAISPSWKAECGSCHTLFPPSMLARPEWARVMEQLQQHFGSDASLEPARHDEVAAFLDRFSSPSVSPEIARDPIPRITATNRFINKHQGALRLLRRGKIRSLADCDFCHARMSMGNTSHDGTP